MSHTHPLPTQQLLCRDTSSSCQAGDRQIQHGLLTSAPVLQLCHRGDRAGVNIVPCTQLWSQQVRPSAGGQLCHRDHYVDTTRRHERHCPPQLLDHLSQQRCRRGCSLCCSPCSHQRGAPVSQLCPGLYGAGSSRGSVCLRQDGDPSTQLTWLHSQPKSSPFRKFTLQQEQQPEGLCCQVAVQRISDCNRIGCICFVCSPFQGTSSSHDKPASFAIHRVQLYITYSVALAQPCTAFGSS